MGPTLAEVIPWGSTADFTCDELNKGGLSLFLTTPEDYASIATYRVRNMVSAPMYGNASSEQGLTAFALDYPMDLKVAGYNPTSVFVWFVYINSSLFCNAGAKFSIFRHKRVEIYSKRVDFCANVS